MEIYVSEREEEKAEPGVDCPGGGIARPGPACIPPGHVQGMLEKFDQGLLGGCTRLAPLRDGIRESIRQCLLPSPAGLECEQRRIGSGGLHPHRCGHGRRYGSPAARAAFRERSGIFSSPLCALTINWLR